MLQALSAKAKVRNKHLRPTYQRILFDKNTSLSGLFESTGLYNLFPQLRGQELNHDEALYYVHLANALAGSIPSYKYVHRLAGVAPPKREEWEEPGPMTNSPNTLKKPFDQYTAEDWKEVEKMFGIEGTLEYIEEAEYTEFEEVESKTKKKPAARKRAATKRKK